MPEIIIPEHDQNDTIADGHRVIAMTSASSGYALALSRLKAWVLDGISTIVGPPGPAGKAGKDGKDGRDGASGATTFVALKDAPSSFVGAGGKLVFVKSDETGLGFKHESEVNDSFSDVLDPSISSDYPPIADVGIFVTGIHRGFATDTGIALSSLREGDLFFRVIGDGVEHHVFTTWAAINALQAIQVGQPATFHSIQMTTSQNLGAVYVGKLTNGNIWVNADASHNGNVTIHLTILTPVNWASYFLASRRILYRDSGAVTQPNNSWRTITLAQRMRREKTIEIVTSRGSGSKGVARFTSDDYLDMPSIVSSTDTLTTSQEALVLMIAAAGDRGIHEVGGARMILVRGAAGDMHILFDGADADNQRLLIREMY